MSARDTALHALRGITAQLADLEHDQAAAVTDARLHGASWDDVADALRVTRQAASRRFRRVDPVERRPG